MVIFVRLPDCLEIKGQFQNLVCALRPTFYRRRAQMDRAISKIYTMHPTFIKSTPDHKGKRKIQVAKWTILMMSLVIHDQISGLLIVQ